MVVSVIPGPDRLGSPAGCRTMPLPVCWETARPGPVALPLTAPPLAAVAAAPELSGEVPTGRPAALAGPRPPFVSVARPSRAPEPAVVATVEPHADSSDAASSRPGANRAPRDLMCPFRLEC